MNSAEKRFGAYPVLNCISNKELIAKKGPSRRASKTYVFDKVLKPTTKQKEVFESVRPIVEEVLSGFNCTVFAYGQTGTGKTWTMEGRLTKDSSHPDAGVVPRAISMIFERLEKKYKEYSVKVSMMEIYNEDLTDLLTKENSGKALRIYEDPSGKKGMLVHGLTEHLATTADQVFALLKQSSEKRKTAETLLNKKSSRSHCVFIVTIHTKVPQPSSDDIIKTGKLFLVDLAGSECVGKSGAVMGRAKEAGKINQSLLTLGRVINSLVEKTGYVPYRDSKLTRLLQESLGGRSKTVIIATVSPSAEVMEETLNTLDYAYRAKNIRNRPQVNQKMTRKAYMRELLVEINDLKRENEALREKNGIFLAPEKWNSIKGELTDKTQRLEEIETELKGNLHEYKNLEKLQQDTAAELKETLVQKESLQETLKLQSSELQSTKQELNDTKIDLDETKYIVSQQQKTEEELSGQAKSIKSTLEHTIENNNKLYKKIDRKIAVEDHNQSSSHSFCDTFSKDLDCVQKQLDTFYHGQQGGYVKLDRYIKETMTKKTKELSGLVQIVNTLSQNINASRNSISQLCSQHHQEMAVNFKNNVDDRILHQQKMKEELDQSQVKLKSFADEIKLKLQREETSLDKWKISLSSLLKSNMTGVNTFVEGTHQQIDSIQLQFKENTSKQVKDLIASQSMVDLQLEQQKESTNSKMMSFMKEIQQLCSNFQESQQNERTCGASEMKKSLQNQIEEINVGNERIITLSKQLKSNTNTFQGERKTMHSSVLDIVDEGIQKRKQHSEMCHNDLIVIQKSTSNQFDQISRDSDEKVSLAQKQQAQNTICVEDFMKQADSMLQDIGNQSTQQIKIHNDNSNKIQAELESNSSDWSGQISNQQKITDTYKTEQSKQCAQLQDQVQTFVDCLKLDEVTGTTPIKAHIAVPVSFIRTEEHDQLLASRRKMMRLLSAAKETQENAKETQENASEQIYKDTLEATNVDPSNDIITTLSSSIVTKLPQPAGSKLTSLSTSTNKKTPSPPTKSQIPVLGDSNGSNKKKRKKTALSKSTKGHKILPNRTKLKSSVHTPRFRKKRIKDESSITSRRIGIEKFPR